MARPRKGQEKRATAAIGLRLPEELRERLVSLAAAHERTLTDEVMHALSTYVDRELKKAKRS